MSPQLMVIIDKVAKLNLTDEELVELAQAIVSLNTNGIKLFTTIPKTLTTNSIMVEDDGA